MMMQAKSSGERYLTGEFIGACLFAVFVRFMGESYRAMWSKLCVPCTPLDWLAAGGIHQ